MQELYDFLKSGTKFDPNYLPSNNSDHLPMTLCAMFGLGATTAQLAEHRENYIEILHSVGPASPLQDWRDALGDKSQYPGVLQLLLNQFENEDWDTLTSQVLPPILSTLLPSLAQQALHPAIRLGYAVDFKVPWEVAAALAYWICAHQPTPVEPQTPIGLREALKAQVNRRPAFSSKRFGARILEQIHNGSYPAGRAASLAECARVSLALYQSTRDFFALHLVTATQALRCCLPFADKDLALASLTGAIIAAYRALDCPDFEDDSPLPMPACIDAEHGYKYAWACLSEYRHYGVQTYAQELHDWREAGLVPAWCGANAE